MEQDLMYSSKEDSDFYLSAVLGLPTLAGLKGNGKDKFDIPLPYGCGPHSVRCLREIVELTQPKSIYCIGTNMGYSDAMWLELSSAKVFSTDISRKDETILAASLLKDRYIDRYFYCNRLEDNFTELLNKEYFDLSFIDGGHLFEDVMKDIEQCISLKIKYLSFDDILPQFGPGVMPAIQQFPQLELIKEMGNIGLYKNNDV